MNKNKKKISIFNIFISFIIIALITSLYINNVIKINKLASETNTIREDIKITLQYNDAMRVEVEKLCSVNRIKDLVNDKLGLKYNENSLSKDYLKINSTELK